MKEFLSNGYAVLKELVPASAVANIREKIKEQIAANAEEIGSTIHDYLFCTGRWASPSTVVSCIDKEVTFLIQNKLENLLNAKLDIEKSNVICKEKNIRDAVPLHQDISYSPKSPYHFSCWLALNDIEENSGPLIFLSQSHKWSISPAVDFWSPDYDASLILKQKQDAKLQVIKLSEGDAVIFDSRLWHGSIKSINGEDRYAYVSRWKIRGKAFPIIPEIKESYFGMWNCQKIAKDIMYEGLKYFKATITTKENLIELISQWQVLLLSGVLANDIDTTKAVKDLENLKILHISASNHNAGDLTGRIYKNLWKSFLFHLQNKMSPLSYNK